MGGVVHAEMLGRTNLVAVVGGGQAPKFPDRNGKPYINNSLLPRLFSVCGGETFQGLLVTLFPSVCEK